MKKWAIISGPFKFSKGYLLLLVVVIVIVGCGLSLVALTVDLFIYSFFLFSFFLFSFFFLICSSTHNHPPTQQERSIMVFSDTGGG